MAISIETYKKITENAELTAKLEAMWKENASTAQFMKVFQAEGIDVEASEVEGVLANMQSKRAEAIALEDVDDEQLRKIAGGSAEDDGRACVDSYFCYSNTYEQCTENLQLPCDGYSVASLY